MGNTLPSRQVKKCGGSGPIELSLATILGITNADAAARMRQAGGFEA